MQGIYETLRSAIARTLEEQDFSDLESDDEIYTAAGRIRIQAAACGQLCIPPCPSLALYRLSQSDAGLLTANNSYRYFVYGMKQADLGHHTTSNR